MLVSRISGLDFGVGETAASPGIAQERSELDVADARDEKDRSGSLAPALLLSQPLRHSRLDAAAPVLLSSSDPGHGHVAAAAQKQKR
jgi:hypothetical protein